MFEEMKCNSILMVLLLVVQLNIKWSEAQLDLRIGFAIPELEGAPTEEEFLNQVIGDELDSLDREQPCSRDDQDSIARRMDRLAERLSTAMDSTDDNDRTQTYNGLADAVGLQEILQVYGLRDQQAAQQKQRRYRSDLGTRHLEQLLEPDNPWIHHGGRISDQGIMQVAKLVSQRALTEDERLFSSTMFNYAARRANEPPSDRLAGVEKKLHEAFSVGTKAVKSVYRWADLFYLNSHFYDHLPVLGLVIRKLREVGRKSYEIMDTVRYMHQVWTKFKNELPVENSETGRLLGSERTKKMFTRLGIKAIKLIATKLLVTGGGPSSANIKPELAIVQEIASRCAYYLFSQLVPRSSYCLIGRNYAHIQPEHLLGGGDDD